MTVYVFDKLTDTADFNVTSYDPAYDSFLTSPTQSGFDAQSISPNGDYVGGGFTNQTIWVAKTTPAGTPSLVMKSVFDGVEWSGNDVGFRDIDIATHCIDDEGFIWGTSDTWGTDMILPQATRHRGVVGYIDPDSPSQITKAFSWTDNPTGDADDFSVNKLSTFTMPDDSIRIIVIPTSSAADPNYLLFENTKGTSSVTVHTTDETWVPQFVFQDSNGDLWACGVPPTPDGTLGFLRFTDVTGSSSYPDEQSFNIPGAGDHPEDAPRGYFAGGFFIGGWGSDAQASLSSACGTVFKLNLTTSAVTSTADVSGDPILLPQYPSNADPTYYFVQKANDPERAYLIRGACRIFYKLTTSLTLTTTFDLDSWVAGDFGIDSGTDHDDVYTKYWSDGRQAFVGFRYQWLLESGELDPDHDRMVADLFIYYFGPEESEPGVVDESVRIRVWGFSLDGHDFYALRIGT